MYYQQLQISDKYDAIITNSCELKGFMCEYRKSQLFSVSPFFFCPLHCLIP